MFKKYLFLVVLIAAMMLSFIACNTSVLSTVPAPTPISWQSYRMVEMLRIAGVGRLWMPVPREWDGIGMANIKVTDISPPPDDLYQDDRGNLIVFWDTRYRGLTDYSITFEIDVAPIQYDIDPATVEEYDTTSPDYQQYTQPSEWIQSDDETIIQLARQITYNEENPLVQARLLHDWVSTNIRGGEIADALTTLERHAADCGGHSFLFVALCRALGIPARPVAGLHTRYQGYFVNGTAQNGTMYMHVWSEFYIQGFGWVQCDTSAGDQNAIGINEPRIVLSRGEDIRLGHDFPDGTVPVFHTPQTDSYINIGTPRTQTWGEDLSLAVAQLP